MDKRFLIEQEVIIPRLNVRGFFDIYDMDKNILYDIKSINSFKYQKMFGRLENRDKNPSVNYELQLATYGIGIMEKYQIEMPELYFLYFNKDKGNIKQVKIDNVLWRKRAEEYWEDVSIYCKNNKDIPQIELGVPNSKWECNYCSFSHICTAPFLTNEKTLNYDNEVIKLWVKHIDKKNEMNRKERYEGNEKYYSCSDAGRCFGIHWFKTNKYPMKEMDDNTKIILNLGTIIHDDWQKGLIDENED